MKVVVKRLNIEFRQGLKEFWTEFQLPWSQQHENIITLVGYCDERKEDIIVYEYAKRGSLDQYIRCENTNYTLTWPERLKIVVDIARGLDHLHNHLQNNQVIIHGDIKSSNILLDHRWIAKISDLGLSKLTFSDFEDTRAVISLPVGRHIIVEMEQEYGLVTQKTDVYSFGMVLFEVLCGRLSYIKDKDGIMLTEKLAKEHYSKDQLDRIIDPAIRGQMSPNSLRKYSAIAYKCLHVREQRPRMDVVKRELEETLNIEVRNF
ncbi:putative protein kinase RLK-Pelle-CrRLK1L-1 family [Helianthus anomalus]